jgi:1,4-alpha-glucan branching enzyme
MVLALALACGCGSPPPPPVGGPEPVEGGVLFRYRNADAKRVCLAGDFNDWSPTSDPMTDDNGDGEWTLFYPLAPGTYAYKFVVDGRNWIADPRNPLSEPDGFNGRNSIVQVLAPGS